MKKLVIILFALVCFVGYSQGTPKVNRIKFIPQGAPSSPVDGEVYAATSGGGLFYYDGTQWLNLTLGASGGAPDQTLSLNGNDLTISGSGGNTVDLSSLSGGGGNDFVNSGSVTGQNLTLVVPNQTNPVIDLSAFALDTEIFDGDYNSLSNLPTLFDGDYNSLTNQPSLFDGAFSSLSGIPSGLSDGDDDTQLTQEQVEDFVGGQVSATGDGLQYTDGSGALTVVDSELQPDWSNIQNIPADIADGDDTGGAGSDGNISNVVLNGTDLDFTGSNGGFNGSVALSSLQDGTGTDDQNLILTGDVLSIENGTGSVDLSNYSDGFEANTDDQTASEVPITDSGANFTATDVEGALAELAGGGGSADGVVSNVAFDGTNLNFTGANGGFNGAVDVSSLSTGGEFGIVAEGTITQPSGGGVQTTTVTHSLGYAPDNTRIQLQEIGTNAQTGNSSISNITSTTFDLSSSEPVNTVISWRIFGNGTLTGITGGEIVTAINTELGSSTWQSGGGGTDDQNASEVPFTATGNTTSTDVQAAIVELQTEIDGIGGGGTDDQTIDVFNLNGTTLELSLENDGQATQTVDLSSLSGSGSYPEADEERSAGMYRVGEVTMTGNEDGTELNYVDLGLERRKRIGVTTGSDARTVSLDGQHPIGHVYRYMPRSDASTITFEATNSYTIIFDDGTEGNNYNEVTASTNGGLVTFWRVDSSIYHVAGRATASFVDNEAPTAPSSLASTDNDDTTIDLSWTNGTDNVAITGTDYRLDGGSWQTLVSGTGTTGTITGLTAATAYDIEVSHIDAAANRSAASNEIAVTTDAGGNPLIPDASESLGSLITYVTTEELTGADGAAITAGQLTDQLGNVTVTLNNMIVNDTGSKKEAEHVSANTAYVSFGDNFDFAPTDTGSIHLKTGALDLGPATMTKGGATGANRLLGIYNSEPAGAGTIWYWLSGTGNFTTAQAGATDGEDNIWIVFNGDSTADIIWNGVVIIDDLAITDQTNARDFFIGVQDLEGSFGDAADGSWKVFEVHNTNLSLAQIQAIDAQTY